MGLMGGFAHWPETSGPDGRPREIYRRLMESLDVLSRSQVKALSDRLDATMREMGVTFDIMRDRPWGRRPWICDLLPQIFEQAEWEILEAGMRQRMRALEAFLADVYGDREILRSGTLPVQPILGSPYYQLVACGLPLGPRPYLHLCGAAVCRLPDGRMAFKHHYFSNASGISYMIQNRRALARVIPQSFGDLPIRSIAQAPVDILEMLRALSDDPDPTVVLLSPGPGSAVFSEHSFLARRMGIPVVQGGDLLVLNDSVYLKTVAGLEKVAVIYTRLADPWLDPLAFRRDSLIGVAGLVNCIRRGTVVIANGIGSQLADDRALLPFMATIIRYYLAERPVMPSLQTYWLGDIDQRELVLGELWKYTIRPLYGERILLGGDGRPPTPRQVDAVRKTILAAASSYVAQPQDCDARALTYDGGRRREQRQDHILFGLRESSGAYEIFPGALTRITTHESKFTANELGGGSKDTWVESPEPEENEALPLVARDKLLPSRHIGSRVAESMYWLGRYMERANSLAVMIRVIGSLELEELNPTERTLYRPVWNKLLPPLENPSGVTRRTISSPVGRYRLALDLAEPDSVVCAVLRASQNAESILECLSLEAWGVVENLRNTLRSIRFRPKDPEARQSASLRKICDEVASRVPEFFGVAEATMVADGAWAFCEVGQRFERAIITANALCSIFGSEGLRDGSDVHDDEIRLSAFLRLLASRDVYRRVYQMRVERGPTLELLWSNDTVPRSVLRCLSVCAECLRSCQGVASPGTRRAVDAIEALVGDIRLAAWLDWADDDLHKVMGISESFLRRTLDLHQTITDGFLNHQIHIREEQHPTLFGPKHAL
ncbi:MAG: circularly permuted type 2 ATP-grasp protein [Terrimicrobiaceae bacterium]